MFRNYRLAWQGAARRRDNTRRIKKENKRLEEADLFPCVIEPAWVLYGLHRRVIFQRTLAISLLILILAGSVAAYYFWGRELIEFVSDSERVRAMVSNHPMSSRLIFVGLVALQVIIAIIPGEPFELAAGYAFGFWEGTFLCILAGYLASLPIFFLVKRFGRPVLELFFEPEKIDEVKLFHNPKRATFLMVIAFLIPGTPKDILTYFAGLTPMKWTTWLLVLLARIPSVVTSTASGGFLGSKRYLPALIVFAATAFFALIGILLYKKINRNEEDNTGRD